MALFSSDARVSQVNRRAATGEVVRETDPSRAQPSFGDRLLRHVHRWVWADPRRRASKLLEFARTEAEGGHDLARAAEITRDGVLRRLYLRHALDEQKHAQLFIARGRDILAELPPGATPGLSFGWLAPGERGGDNLHVEQESDASLLAFLHLSEKAAVGRFALYREVLSDKTTAAVFTRVLRDEEFHMTYTRSQLARIAPRRQGWSLWRGRLDRMWKAYLRLAIAIAGVLGTVMLLLQYFVILPVFALLARLSARREKPGWVAPTTRPRERALRGQY